MMKGFEMNDNVQKLLVHMRAHGLIEESYLVAKIANQNSIFLEACKAFIRYDEGDQEDGVALMMDYAEANQFIRAAVANAEE